MPEAALYKIAKQADLGKNEGRQDAQLRGTSRVAFNHGRLLVDSWRRAVGLAVVGSAGPFRDHLGHGHSLGLVRRRDGTLQSAALVAGPSSQEELRPEIALVRSHHAPHDGSSPDRHHAQRDNYGQPAAY
jgi:hypothetical protein